ncbi:nuclear transport factor 2 family protein [Actinoplanes sp. L3-i22]|uniref:nuclear transport factor 2 family protein n=1 Tax=Actinoplanes sp. L3-i22 TaxID=2836373 RepID=UPI001C77A195|nr:nuclear transport factor 2 family protein [Actinoplanes sp. L3-i22]BCY06771.1 isomerase [Actinoplanes sp. L3-i22]
MSDFDAVIERYLAVWNETDPAARRAAIAGLFADDVHYVDPVAAVHGHAGLDGLIGAVHQQFPGLVFSAGGPVDAHHDQARFTWHLGRPGEEPLVIGFDVAERDTSGRIARVYGFIDKAPSGM